MMLPRLDLLVAAVQANCHVADARHAGDLTLCTYLLEMREFYRWEHGIDFADEPPRAAISAWITEREALWDAVADTDFQPLPLAGERYAPFDAAAVNRALAPHGLVYGAGIGAFGRPQFFLGELKKTEERGGVTVLTAGCEYARSLTAPPATLRDATVELREESLKRWLWERFEGWAVKRPGGAMQATLAAYGFEEDPRAALERMAAAEAETLVLHELGEYEAGGLLGAEWAAMRAGLASRRAELALRALRDNLADCLVTLPTLRARGADASIHFWFSNFDGVRREMFPLLADAYAAWCAGRPRPLDAAAGAGARHWRALAERALAAWRERGALAAPVIAGWLDDAAVRL